MMPEQSEWTEPAKGDSGDYRWHPSYARRAMDSLNPAYDVRTLADKVAEQDKRIAHLEAIVHKYINQGAL